MQRFLALAFLLLKLSLFVAGERWVSFWYAPTSADLNSTIGVLRRHKDAVTSVMLYCGHSVDNTGQFVGEAPEICVGKNGIVPALRELGIGVEFVVNDGSTNATAHKAFMANATNVGTLTSIAKKYNLTGWNLDLEPQKVPGTADDAKVYASFCKTLRASLNNVGTRLTIDVAQWSPMLNQFETLAPTVDRLMNMETYNADSLFTWLHGGRYGGDYENFVNNNIPRSVNGVGLGCWYSATCGNHTCWSTRQESVAPRIDQMIKDGVPEAAMFRLAGDQRYPEDFWWPELLRFRNSDAAAAVNAFGPK